MICLGRFSSQFGISILKVSSIFVLLTKTTTSRMKKKIGYSILVMTLLSFIGFGSNNLEGLTAQIAIGLIILLDAWLSLAFYRYYRLKSRTLAALTAGLRLIYTLAFLWAYAMLLNGDVFHFYLIWEPSLVLFGAHLICLGLIAGRPFWTQVLLVLGGLAYMTAYFNHDWEPYLVPAMLFGELSYAFVMAFSKENRLSFD